MDAGKHLFQPILRRLANCLRIWAINAGGLNGLGGCRLHRVQKGLWGAFRSLGRGRSPRRSEAPWSPLELPEFGPMMAEPTTASVPRRCLWESHRQLYIPLSLHWTYRWSEHRNRPFAQVAHSAQLRRPV